MRSALLPLLLTLAAGPLAAQQTEYLFEVDPAASLIDWNATTSLGSVTEMPPQFRMEGTLSARLDAPSAPFASVEILDAMVWTDPAVISGEIPNPLPGLPPLASFDLAGLHATTAAPAATVTAGAFTADLVLTTTAGTLSYDGLFGNGSGPAHGFVSSVTPTAGTVSQSGAQLRLQLDLDVDLTVVLDPVSGTTATINLNGPLVAYADTGNADPLYLDVALPMTAGGTSTPVYRNAAPGGAVYLGGSVSGPGSTFIPPLGGSIGLDRPALVDGPVTTNSFGTGAFTVTVPAGLAGRSLWLQAVEAGGRVSNVAGSYVR